MKNLIAALLATCASPGPARLPDDARPAVIVEPNVRSRAALLQAVTDLLGGARPLLADDALTRESTLIIERTHLEGRDRGVPEHFRLFLSNGICVLVREKTGQSATLVETRCVVYSTP